MSDLPPTLGDTLRALRKRADISNSDVAKKIGVSRQMVYHYEAGRNSPPSDVMKVLLDLYGASRKEREHVFSLHPDRDTVDTWVKALITS